MSNIRLYVARHGETNFNKEGRYLGSIDEPLNKNGLNQASQLGKKLVKCKIEKIITSPLTRCIQTAEEINAFLNLDHSIMKEFRERKVGVYEGLTRKEVQLSYPSLWKKNITKIWNNAPTGGETIQEVINRVFKGIDMIRQSDDNKRILAVTHGFISKAFYYYFNPDISKEDFFNYKLENGEIEIYNF